MKITRIETFCVQVGARPTVAGTASANVHAEADFRGSRNWLFIKVHTDSGLYGVGEGSGWPRVVERAVQDYATILVGEDPTHIDRLWHRLFLASMGHGVLGTVGAGALTAIEMALWDLKGKVLGQPVWNLLGGRFRHAIPVYGHAKTPESAQKLLERSYRALKVGFTGAVDLDRLFAIRDSIGPEIDMMVDAHGPSWMTVRDAIRIGRELEPLDLLFYEDPIAPEQWESYARIRDAVDVPLAAGERLATIWGLRPLIERELVDVLQPDTGRAGGITQMRKIAAMAEAHGIMMAPHSGSLGPVAEVAALHILATIPNCLMLERLEFDWPARHEVVTPVVKVENGAIAVPDSPGLGVDLVLDEIAKYPSRRNVTDLPPDDGWAFEPGTVGEAVYTQTRLRRRARLRRQDAGA